MATDSTTLADGAGALADATASTAEPQVNWQAEAENYRRRFNGLQGAFQKTQDELAQQKAAKFDLEQRLTAVTGEHAASDIERKSLAEKYEAANSEVKSLKEKADRLGLLTSDFRDLLDFEAKGLLPSGNGEELKNKLADFRTALATRGQEAVTKLTSGATPPAPQAATAQSTRDLLRLAAEAQSKGDTAGYTSFYNQYVKLSNQK